MPLGAIGNFQTVEKEAAGRDLVQIDFRGDAEAAIGQYVVEYVGVEAVVGRSNTGASGVGAVWREKSAHFDVVGVVVVDAAGDDEIAGEEDGNAWKGSEVVVLRADGNAGGEGGCREDSESLTRGRRGLFVFEKVDCMLSPTR